MAVDVIFVRRLLHAVAYHHAERANSVALLVLLQLALGDERETLVAVTAHQRLPGRKGETAARQRWEQDLRQATLRFASDVNG